MDARRERSGVHGCVCRNVGIQTRIRSRLRRLRRKQSPIGRRASNESQAQCHGCWDDQLPCCPLQETLDALPDILFLHDPRPWYRFSGAPDASRNCLVDSEHPGKPHSVDAAWNAPVKAGTSLVRWCLIQWATVVRLGSRLGSRLQCYIMVQIETAWNTRPLRFQIFTNDFAR
jgi:hypothetical protein